MHIRFKPAQSIDSEELRKWITGAGAKWPVTPEWVIQVNHQTGDVVVNEGVLTEQQKMQFHAILHAHPDYLETL